MVNPGDMLASLKALSQQLAFSDALLVVACAGLIMHQIARRYEPTNHTSNMTAFILLPPTLLTPLLAPHTHSVVLAFLLTFVTYTTTLTLSTLTYRLSPWHPLARYPGPLPSRMSKLWSVWKARNGKQYLYYQSLHEKYGDFVRVGPNELSARTADAVVPVLGAHGLPKGPVWDGRANIDGGFESRSLIALREWDAHASRRKLWNKGFSTASLKDYEAIIVRRGKQLVEALAARGSKGPVNIAQWCGFFTFDFMGDMAFGGGFELMRDGGDKEGLWEIIESAQRPTMLVGHVPWVTPWIRKLTPFNKEVLRLLAFVTAQVAKRRDEGSLSRDLFHHLFEADGSISSLSLERVIAETTLGIIAGADTTSTVISTIWYFCCEEQSYLTRLQAEIDATFPNLEEPFDALKLSQMPLLNAMINEAMRLMPATPSGAQRAVLPGTGGRTIGSSNYLPEGTSIFVNNYALHRDPRAFSPHPESFWPDRWLAPSDRAFPARLFGPSPNPPKINDAVILDTTAFIPFSFGPAGCVGKNLALGEMRIIVALVAQKFSMRYAEEYNPEQWWKDAKDWYIWELGELPVVLIPRF